MPATPANPLCQLCGSPLKRATAGGGGGPHFDCPNCGRYGVSDFHTNEQGRLTFDPDTVRKLRHLLGEHRIRGGSPIFLSTTTGGTTTEGEAIISVTEFLERYPRTSLEFFDRALENLSLQLKHPTDLLQVYVPTYYSMLCEASQGQLMLQQFIDLGYMAIGNDASGKSGYVITPKGWQKVVELRKPGHAATQAFVAMWFASSQTTYFEEAFRPAIEADGKTKAIRIDRKDHNNKIDDEIIAEIRRSRYLVADFTGHRGGVYFEAGFALGLGIPVIWCCHQDHIREAHFDTRQYNHITYATPGELREKLRNRIRATIT